MTLTNESWLNRLEMLVVKFSYLGLNPDLANLTLLETWALYLYLNRLTGD